MIKDIAIGFLVFVVAPWVIGSLCPWEHEKPVYISRWVYGLMILAAVVMTLFILMVGGQVIQLALSEFG